MGMSIIILITLLLFLFVELLHKFRSQSKLVLTPKGFRISNDNLKNRYIAWIEISNPYKSIEIMIPSFKVSPLIIGIDKAELVNINTKVIPPISSENEFNNEYWSALILKSKSTITIEVEVEIELNKSFNNIKCLWLEVEWINYGPFGYIRRFDGFAIPNLSNKDKLQSTNPYFIEPIKTHILGALDDPISVLETYLPKDKLPTDILTIGETPLAIMQGRYIDYRSIKISFLAKVLCKGFHPTSSLATACGMQSLINSSRPTRIILAWFIGGIFKILGFKGMFYRLAGSQARLIDDITGTTPPYDKSIVLGPKATESFCTTASKKLGVNIAVVDVNDLGKVKVISSNKKSNIELIKKALISNPAGNANQHTPIVFIRPSKAITNSQVN